MRTDSRKLAEFLSSGLAQESVKPQPKTYTGDLSSALTQGQPNAARLSSPIDHLLKNTQPESPASNPLKGWLDQYLKNFEEDSIESGEEAAPQNSARQSSPTVLAELLTPICNLANEIRGELDSNLHMISQLNRGRREELLSYLGRLSGTTLAAQQQDSRERVQKWISGPRTTQQNHALQTYIEEVALMFVGQVLILKTWNDQGIRKWSEKDLGQLNWSLSWTLKPKVPLNREGWQLTRPNLYSWYKPSPTIRRKIFSVLSELDLSAVGPELLDAVLKTARRNAPSLPEIQGYDTRFYRSIWENLSHLGFNSHSPGECDTNGFKREPVVFCPTLRDGSVMRSGPNSLNWVGLESYPFLLMIAELSLLWKGPVEPPLWAQGNGLGVHAREQLSMSWSASRPSVTTCISEMEACDLAFVFEERSVYPNGRSIEAVELKQDLEEHPYFNQMKGSGTTLGDMQVAVSITKLRPGGILIWTRETPLSSNDGTDYLKFVLEHCEIVGEWNLASIDHSLPSSGPLCPRYMYVLRRQPEMEKRNTFHPVRIQVSGVVRSHFEVPILLNDALSCLKGESKPKGNWKVISQVSPTCQLEWAEHWPDHMAHKTIQSLDGTSREVVSARSDWSRETF